MAIKRTDKRRLEAKRSEKLDRAVYHMIRNLWADDLSPEQISARWRLELGVKISP